MKILSCRLVIGLCVATVAWSQITPLTTTEEPGAGPEHFYLVNPGSVGQPRDGDPRAAYALYSPENRTIEFRRVAYDVATAASKILGAGLPPPLAARLFEGM